MSDDIVPKPRRGWSSQNLPVVELLDERYWSVFDAASLLGPPRLTESRVRDLIRLAGLTPVGKRPNGSKRRHVRVYLAEELLRVYEQVAVLTGAAD